MNDFASSLSPITNTDGFNPCLFLEGGRLDEEKTFIRSIIEEQGVDYTNPSYQVVIQTPLRGRGADILTKADLLVHVDMMKNISTMTLDMFGQ